jgi:hypothetical protein
MSMLLNHWRQLEDQIHPLDKPVFDSAAHSFNLQFPPPAYVGDLENAPVVLLEANGGFDPIVTPSEFLDQGAVERFIDFLHRPRAVDPSTIAPYYGARNYASAIASGELVLVNAVPYRSPSISKEPQNRRLAERLPSTKVHRNWLRSELLVQAQNGDRLVIAHRTALWKIKRTEEHLNGVFFTSNPVSANLSKEALAKMKAFLK